jgi:hypothetical protein
MDGALIRFSFLSLCHPGFTFFLFAPISPDLSLFLELYFLPARHPVFFFFLAFETFLTHLLTYKFKMCYSHPHPPTCPSIILPTNALSKYLPNLTYMATPTYMVAIAIDPLMVNNDEGRIK